MVTGQPHTTALQLILAVQAGEPGAMAQFDALCGGDLTRLVERRVAARKIPRKDQARWIARALIVARMHVLACDPTQFNSVSCEVLRVWIGSSLLDSFNTSLTTDPGSVRQPASLPQSPDCRVEVFFVPQDTIAGGDWFGGDLVGETDYWIILCDVTGHDRAAHILASNLNQLWNSTAIAQQRSVGKEPAEVLQQMKRRLDECVPDSTFVQAVLARIGRNGRASVVGSGHFLFKRARQRTVEKRAVSGAMLGSPVPGPYNPIEISLQNEDQMLLSTDGLFEQRHATGRIGDHLDRLRVPSAGSLHRAVVKEFEQATSEFPAADDVTVVTVSWLTEGDRSQ